MIVNHCPTPVVDVETSMTKSLWTIVFSDNMFVNVVIYFYWLYSFLLPDVVSRQVTVFLYSVETDLNFNVQIGIVCAISILFPGFVAPHVDYMAKTLVHNV